MAKVWGRAKAGLEKARPRVAVSRRWARMFKCKGAKMPSVFSGVRQQYTEEQEAALMEIIHRALREAFKIVPGDKNVRPVSESAVWRSVWRRC